MMRCLVNCRGGGMLATIRTIDTAREPAEREAVNKA
jgi:hypothetical protein